MEQRPDFTQHWPGAPQAQGGAVPPPKGIGLAVAAVVLGLLGLAAPLLPIALDGVRQFVGAPFAVAGLVLAVIGCSGHRRGKGLAVAGAVLSALALLLSSYLIVTFAVESL